MPTRKVAVLGTPGFVRDPDRFGDDALLNIVGQNSGNLMFQYAASQILAVEKSHIGMSEQAYGSAEAVKDVSYLVFPAANHLRAGADWTGLNDFLAKSKVPLIILGLGAQSPKIGGEAGTLVDLRADRHVMRMIEILRDKAAFVSVRGEYTRSICEELGLKGTTPLGCPSALLSPDLNLGMSMAARLGEASAAQITPRFGLTAAAPFEIRANAPLKDLERKLFQWVRSRGGPYFQQSGGEAVMRLCRKGSTPPSPDQIKTIRDILQPAAEIDPFIGYFQRLARFHLSAPEWMAETAELSFVIGTRVHGNMAAIGSGTPGIVIAHDSRTDELASTMKLPRVSIEAVLAAADMKAVLGSVTFDGAVFDDWRRKTASTFAAEMARLEIAVAPHVTALARAGA